MFDFPKTVTDYLHRAGRTGRMGSKGTVTSLYSTKDAALAHKINVWRGGSIHYIAYFAITKSMYGGVGSIHFITYVAVTK